MSAAKQRLSAVERPAEPTFGFSTKRGGVVHRLAGVRIFDTIRGAGTGIEHRWQCGNAVMGGDVTLLPAPPARSSLCLGCPSAELPDGPLVYLARVDDYLKVGHSVQVGARMKQLQGELLRVTPGDRRTERFILDHCPVPTRGREWFRPEDEPAIVAVFEQAVQAS